MKLYRKRSERRPWEENESEGAVPWLFVLPSLLAVTVLVLLPFIDVVRRSFFSAMSGQFVGFKNYLTVFQNDAFRLAAGNTAKFVAVCIPLLLVFSLLLALLVNAFREKRGVFKTSFLIPMAIPVASIVLLWKVVFHENGLFNIFLGWLGAAPVDWLDSELTFAVLVFSYLWKNTGYDMILWLSGITAISPALYESAQIDGAGALQRFFRITLPGLMPTLFTITVLSLLNSFKVFREAYLIGGNYPNTSIYMLQHLFNNWFADLDVDKMCAGAVLMALVVFLLIMLLQRFWGREAQGE
ncbi:carbohydrate ABC transporter permease [Pseudoflavonifractor phocaeensis]|uniref:carbohydrate ABC transporter permease n=1 Tax=Pseudoflavonifractor phocaeensis TaxID=1870988 RepID=UPI001313128B|nr:sugar ABC transporter permease [Pseudoflavonifractor phocaeensis]MTQ95855.1 ABC transporter permease subunit [Pseudoflavonifractor sp. BIOML-A16]MTR04607.1 ABC transporter permease subunit [Pseudoflavonifractor sp. BIOML-A15]MTR11996.1 ABC transporter permease subunit [Pseudoflavonifractor sp. BIOML-A17]MTR19682.1 ABC transporter permease subunit [Pseudoflavonifractor sp. BIOML-A19]MTR31145.1 ABC transporter permease subunit [Pseudoflavonifractor sp. BIOML-A14]MTR34503.1 ABC transporter pe